MSRREHDLLMNQQGLTWQQYWANLAAQQAAALAAALALQQQRLQQQQIFFTTYQIYSNLEINEYFLGRRI